MLLPQHVFWVDSSLQGPWTDTSPSWRHMPYITAFRVTCKCKFLVWLPPVTLVISTSLLFVCSLFIYFFRALVFIKLNWVERLQVFFPSIPFTCLFPFILAANPSPPSNILVCFTNTLKCGNYAYVFADVKQSKQHVIIKWLM